MVGAISEDMARTPGKQVASVAVDNAATGTANALAERLSLLPNGKKVLVSRDGSHCIDLAPKDLAESTFIKSVLNDAVEIVKFLGKDRIQGVVSEMWAEGTPRGELVYVHPETRMYLAADTALKLCSWRPLLAALNFHPSYVIYYNGRTPGKSLALFF